MASDTCRATPVADLIAREAMALRARTIRVHRGRAGREDLEDFYSQAVLELLARAKRDPTLSTAPHVRNALRQKFEDRLRDHQRAAAGRSPATHARVHASPLDLVEQLLGSDRDAVTELIERETLRELCAAVLRLTLDQRLALASQLNDEAPCDCAARLGWTLEKYRKVAQRARARLHAPAAAVAP
jgi:hypothetical protein